MDGIRNASVHAPRDNYVNVQTTSLHLDSRPGIFQHPPSRIKFDPLLLGRNPKLIFACGIKQKALDKLAHAVVFEILLKKPFGKPSRVFQREVLPSAVQKAGWLEYELDLANYGGKWLQLLFVTSVPKRQGTEYCWSIWGDPRIEHEVPPSHKNGSPIRPAHVILITTDALRTDHIGAYGNEEIRTPTMDQLAGEGVLFAHARAQTPCTLGSFASMLFSQHPHVHSINAEWGAVKKGLASLPGHLHENGYKTILLPSEQELTDSRTGIPTLFDECVPCIGAPAQDGSMTTRIALDLLDRQEQRTFCWFHYFDTHPPVTPPESDRSMCYNGDPRAGSNRFRPDSVKRILGTEVMQDLNVSLPLLKQGRIDGLFLAKLASTVSAFRGNHASEPDLAIHLKGLGRRAQGNMPAGQFTAWLEEQVVQLNKGSIPPALLDWLDEIQPMLREINDDITAWLDGVVDFRYPVSQYKAAVSYFDSHLGNLFAHWKDKGLYEQSLIIITSPHGEILDEHDIYFHHHTLAESCLRIPMIIKPPQNGRPYKTGARIDGIFDSLDLFPTVIELLGLKPPGDIAGTGRARHIYEGSDIPEHDSYAENNASTMRSITRGRYKYIKVEKEHISSTLWHWRRGDRSLFDLQDVPPDSSNRMDEFPELAREMEKRLDLFFKKTLS